MSNRDESLRRLAEEIAVAVDTKLHRSPGPGRTKLIREEIEDRLTAFRSEREESAPWAPLEAAAIIDALLTTSRPDRALRSRAEEFSVSCRRVRRPNLVAALAREGSEG